MSTLNHYQILQVQYLEKSYVNFKPVPDITGTVFRETGLNQTSIGPTFAFRIDSYSVYTG
jgi:hypothetical protein